MTQKFTPGYFPDEKLWYDYLPGSSVSASMKVPKLQSSPSNMSKEETQMEKMTREVLESLQSGNFIDNQQFCKKVQVCENKSIEFINSIFYYPNSKRIYVENFDKFAKNFTLDVYRPQIDGKYKKMAWINLQQLVITALLESTLNPGLLFVGTQNLFY